ERVTIHEVMNGYPCGRPAEPCDPENRPYFRWASNATRAQISKVTAIARGYNDPPVGQMFEDVPSTNDFYVWIERLAMHNVMGGYRCGVAPAGPCVPPDNRPYFLPYNNVTRGQASKIVA